MPATPDQRAAFEALLSQIRLLAGTAADRVEVGLRGIWEGVEDPEEMLREMATQLRERRAVLAECNESDEEPGPS